MAYIHSIYKMVVSNTQQIQENFPQNYDKNSELKAFDDTKAGVKGLVDAGITEVPRIFIHPEGSGKSPSLEEKHFIFPFIDLENMNNDLVKHKEMVKQIGDASETWGFFQVINHGIPVSVLDEMLRGARRFFEQDIEIKKQYYHRDYTQRVAYNSNFDLYSPKAISVNWSDSLYSTMGPDPLNPEELPEACREITMEYSHHVEKMGCTLLELMSESLGLKPSHLNEMECSEGLSILCNYYPACPQPELVIGLSKHTDNDFFTVLLQDDLGGLQVLHQNQWVDVPPTPGALVINIGDVLHLISNDKYKSVEHRALSKKVGPRISIASFFSSGPLPSSRLYGPIEELLSEENPPKYRATTLKEFYDYFSQEGLDGTSNLSHLRI
ncbi:1-aminocyclopropane-1-carboxylate oxidase homolog [Nicotiana tabacum]|uniref:1-aminocyclopropane-1-carboxylate oxidase homolog n=1 Tax=Nicotiana tabacum TaxID=4097 RepID=A0A1S4A789_TOBAC|nr:PREDICTED: 1-aminocyclopropane-1-carboxylate oxidase homolog [Nicotiana tabacum]